MKSYVIGNGVVADGLGTFLDPGAVVVEDGKIVAVKPIEEVSADDGEWIDVGGRLILPGLVNMHHHFYSQFASGISPHGDCDGFIDVLQDMWWPLDAAMDRDAVYWSGICGAMDSLCHGVTTVFDHHASMNFVEGALDVLSQGIDVVGIKAALCLEMSDRLGRDRIEGQFEENLRFWSANRNSSKRRGMLGLHANFTLSDQSMAYIGRERPGDMAIHVHCGEGRMDYDYCQEKGFKGPVDRLDSFGLLSSSSLLIHCIHISNDDYRIIREKSPGVVTNPESNANNRVGAMDRSEIGPFLLGTDGMSGDMIASLRSAFLLDRQADSLWEGLGGAFFSNRYDYVRKFFPDVVGFEPGSAADIAVLDYVPLTPISNENLLGHLIFGAKGGKAFMTLVDGEILWREGRFSNPGLADIHLEARKVVQGFHRRFYSAPWTYKLYESPREFSVE